MSMPLKFQEWSLAYSGCDGGDIGSPHNKSIWVCGIEWGGGHDPEGLLEHINQDLTEPPQGYETWEENISYIFNWQVMKLLSAIHGGSVDAYKVFAEQKKPFVAGSNGFFKMNLYPIGFKDTDQNKWQAEFSDITGFTKKHDYISWCKTNRFPAMRSWAKTSKPELIICFGKTYQDDFTAAFYDSNKNYTHESIDGNDISWGVNNEGALVVILPFMVNPNSLNKNSSIQKVGERISQLKTANK
jgi:hypothetical protein